MLWKQKLTQPSPSSPIAPAPAPNSPSLTSGRGLVLGDTELTNIIPTVQLCVRLPGDLRTKLDLRLFSEAEGRVPKGAHQQLICQLLRELFDHQTLDLSPYTGEMPEVHKVSGSPRSIAELKILLEQRE